MNKITIRQEKPGQPLRGMWRAKCPHCPLERSQRIQYWSFGATLGAVQEHIRRDHRDLK